MRYRIEINLPKGSFWETTTEERARVKRDLPVRRDFEDVAAASRRNGRPFDGHATEAAARKLAESITDLERFDWVVGEYSTIRFGV